MNKDDPNNSPPPGSSPPSRALDRPVQVLRPSDGPRECRRCDLWKHATQAVVGEGSPTSAIMLVGEQPGDEEDRRGHPFVGPAGRVLESAMTEASLDRSQVFLTNAVKHFKWEPRGKRRLHKKPQQQEIRACHTWLEREIAEVAPLVIVALGGTAIRALTGLQLTIDEARKMELRAVIGAGAGSIGADASGARVIATYHPSAVLRSEDDRRDAITSALTVDLRFAATLAEGSDETDGAAGHADREPEAE